MNNLNRNAAKQCFYAIDEYGNSINYDDEEEYDDWGNFKGYEEDDSYSVSRSLKPQEEKYDEDKFESIAK